MRHTIKDIKCNVDNCIYNENRCECTAGKIEVGPSSACCCSETLCATFEPKHGTTEGNR
ncbi:MAG: DUF1540 domain-containing protein [Oscillospiraceae bacterium]|nr:DUF1540 domain-containing protein [Ruminococcus sp.]MDD7337656.1 DUF1540 domain-containing protein [Ruminococcus sp.]MDY6061620.1 DUF1540 domain-containing protein [Oscillospiraceae bacterium]